MRRFSRSEHLGELLNILVMNCAPVNHLRPSLKGEKRAGANLTGRLQPRETLDIKRGSTA